MTRATTDTTPQFLVESYRPGLDADGLRSSASRLRATIAELGLEGKQIRLVSSTIVPVDEGFLSTFEAASEEVVREAYARARVPFDRISTAICHEGGSKPFESRSVP